MTDQLPLHTQAVLDRLRSVAVKFGADDYWVTPTDVHANSYSSFGRIGTVINDGDGHALLVVTATANSDDPNDVELDAIVIPARQVTGISYNNPDPNLDDTPTSVTVHLRDDTPTVREVRCVPDGHFSLLT